MKPLKTRYRFIFTRIVVYLREQLIFTSFLCNSACAFEKSAYNAPHTDAVLTH
jgi:hypothetical protein